MDERICLECGKEIPIERHHRAKYCDTACQRLHERKQSYHSRCERIEGYSNRNCWASEIKARYNCKCAICGWVVAEKNIITKRGVQWAKGNELHHIVPVSEGGANDFNNLILLCPNHHKQADMGVITKEELKARLLNKISEVEKKKMAMAAADNIDNILFGE